MNEVANGKGANDSLIKGGSLSETVYHYVLSEIREGHYHPGERVRESEICNSLNVSRTPVREAFRRLQSEGRLIVEPQRGAIVAELDHQEVAELYALRQELESVAAKFAAQFASESELATMEYILQQSEKVKDDPRALNQINWELHNAIYNAAHNRFLTKVFQSLSDSMALLRGTKYIPDGRPEALIEEHRQLVEAIKSRDGESAATAARNHVKKSFQIHLEAKLNI
ncbi:GntR family transcriptional regulator [Vibrio inusitatus NBRC 102082]|uniref:GntR family transcriptional regulator n=1 Tax=Vibrio inusitatus NBRC 102082 TaxID=1219070 RepID=A0A4Y3HX28_9VIBR|nr:GntR family transcriptional regulator [Vibrio inusitatus]GEA51637.1 GntR family transcriptional regulator [Vibrio inusitatus NBRC 102082]